MTSEYPPPGFLEEIEPTKYTRWLNRKAQSLVHRDRRRWPEREIQGAQYKKKIHDAVKSSEGRDFYTGEPLKWELIGEYNGADAQKGGACYRRKFADLPTVDHEDPTCPDTHFRICALRTNDCKSDLKPEELEKFCEKVLQHGGQGTGGSS